MMGQMGHMSQDDWGIVGGVFLLIWFVLMIGMLVSWVIMLVAVWRTMKAHETIASRLKEALSSRRGEG